MIAIFRDLSSNNVQILDDSVFDSLTLIQNMFVAFFKIRFQSQALVSDLSGNALTSIQPKLFDKTVSLASLFDIHVGGFGRSRLFFDRNFGNNELTAIPDNAFDKCTQLQQLFALFFSAIK